MAYGRRPMRWLLLLPLLLGCPASVDELVFELPDGTAARDVTFDFGPRGGPGSVTVLLKNVSDHSVSVAEPLFEGGVGTAFLVTGLTSQTFEKGAQVPIVIQLVPTAEHTGVIRLASPKGLALASLTLSGRLDATRCALPDVVDFGAVLPGERPQRTVRRPARGALHPRGQRPRGDRVDRRGRDAQGPGGALRARGR
jgi:hypothetical protein